MLIENRVIHVAAKHEFHQLRCVCIAACHHCIN